MLCSKKISGWVALNQQFLKSIPRNQMEDFDDNIFDEDDALDYILFDESEKGDQQPQGGAGCLGILLLLILPTGMVLKIFC